MAQRLPHGTHGLDAGHLRGGGELRPNGIALLADDSFLVAQLGAAQGSVYRLTRQGRVEHWLMEVAGEALPPASISPRVAAGRTGSRSAHPSRRALGERRRCIHGFIACVQPHGRAAVVADGLGYTKGV